MELKKNYAKSYESVKMMNNYYIVELRKGSFIEEFVITNCNTSESAARQAKEQVKGLGWVVQRIEQGLVTAPMPDLTS